MSTSEGAGRWGLSSSPLRKSSDRRTLVAIPLLPLIHFGTSTWTYEGWQGQVYKREYTKSKFSQECLGEYCQYQYQGEPLFRTPDTQSQTGLSLQNRCAGSLESVAAEEIRLV